MSVNPEISVTYLNGTPILKSLNISTFYARQRTHLSRLQFLPANN